MSSTGALGGRRGRVAIALAALTLFTTTMAGAQLTAAYFGYPEADRLADLLRSPRAMLSGFALYGVPLVFILGAHELGHLVVLRRLGIARSPPFLLPLPPPLGFTGTLGAVITLGDPLPDRRAMLRVAVAGPLAGLAAAVCCIVVGLALSPTSSDLPSTDATDAGGLVIQTPLLYDAIAALMGVGEGVAVHPLAIAGWWGLLMTSLQLFPAGQLDGGHMMRALLGPRARHLTYVTVAILAVLGVTTFGGYGILAIAVILVGTRPPAPLNDSPVGAREWLLAAIALMAMIICFVPAPIRLA